MGRREEDGKIDWETMRSMQKKGLTDRVRGEKEKGIKRVLRGEASVVQALHTSFYSNVNEQVSLGVPLLVYIKKKLL